MRKAVQAAKCGDLALLQTLHKVHEEYKRFEIPVEDCMIEAAKQGHVEVLKFLEGVYPDPKCDQFLWYDLTAFLTKNATPSERHSM